MGLFGLFGKKYTRERYEAAKKAAQSAEKDYMFTGSGYHDRGNFYRWSQDHYDALIEHVHESENRLKELYQQGHKEALKLQEKYDALVAKIVKDEKALSDFEKNELGMHKRGNVKRHLGTITGIISIASFILASLIVTNIQGNLIGTNGDLSPNFIFLAIGLISGIMWMILRKA